MSSRWLSTSLRSLVSYIGKGIVPKYVESEQRGSMVVLGQRCVRNQTVDYGQARLHDGAAKHVKNEKHVQQGDILINATGVGSAGRVAQVVEQPGQLCTTDGHVITLRASEGIDPYYLGYFLKSKQAMIEQMAEGSTGQTEMNRNRLQDEIMVTYPEDLSSQRAIASIGLNLDSKIAINSRLNDYLDELCEVIARKYCESGANCLSDICCQVTDKANCEDADFDTYVSTESLLQNKQGRQQATSLPATGKVTRYIAGDTLISNIRPYFKKVWYASFDGTCSGDILVFRANSVEYAPYLHACLRQDRFFEHVMRGAKGTKMPRGDKKQMMEFIVSVTCRSDDLSLLNAALSQVAANDVESTRLEELRDTLLPKLMSGEIDVSKVDLRQPNNHLPAD